MRITKRKDFPKCIRHFKELKGICIGECVDPSDKLDEGQAAHAHPYAGFPHQGWICFRHKYQLKEKLTLLHEVAHLIANKWLITPHHGKLWKAAVVAIGGTYKSYTYTHNYKTYEYLDYTYRNRKL